MLVLAMVKETINLVTPIDSLQVFAKEYGIGKLLRR